MVAYGGLSFVLSKLYQPAVWRLVMRLVISSLPVIKSNKAGSTHLLVAMVIPHFLMLAISLNRGHYSILTLIGSSFGIIYRYINTSPNDTFFGLTKRHRGFSLSDGAGQVGLDKRRGNGV